MTILVWIYRLVSFFLLFVLATNALVRFVALSPFGEVGRYLLLAANILLFVVILATGLRIRIQSKIVWSATLIWSLLFFWWAWIETQSSPFILHELHTFDPEETRLEIRHFQIQAVSAFCILLTWFASFPFLYTYEDSRRRRVGALNP